MNRTLALIALALAVPLATAADDAVPADEPTAPSERSADPAYLEAANRKLKLFWHRHVVPEGERREPQQVIDALQAAAEQGHPEAQHMLGMMLAGSEQDAARAKGIEWLTEAGKQGHPIALMQLGLMATERGETAKAFTHFEAAAASGEPDANYAFGLIYLNGENVEADPARAADLFEVAARAGHPRAQMRLAAAYWNGRGRSSDPEEACFWFRIAAPEDGEAAAFLPTAEAALDDSQRERVAQRASSWKPEYFVPSWSDRETAEGG